MKRLLFITIGFALLLAACNKTDDISHLEEDDGCMERITIPVTAHTINNADIMMINGLFSNNGINNTRYRYYQYFRDSVQTYFPPYAKFDSKTIKVDEYTNGLRILTGQMAYQFKNDVFNFRAGEPTAGTNLNTVPRLTLGQLRKLFIDHIEQFDHKGSLYKDSCFKAEFGYFNLNAGTSYTPEKLAKAWRVTRKNSTWPSEYPIAYYEDNDGKLIYYDNGIRTFR